MAERTASGDAALPRPGWAGRLIRLALGLGMLLLLSGLFLSSRHDLWSGELPYDVGFAIALLLALRYTSYVFNIPFRLEWGQRTLVGVLIGATVAAGAGLAVQGGLPNTPLGVYLWAWLVAFCGLLGSAHLLAAVLGTPGCEMRSFAHLAVLLRGGDVGAVACPGGIDRFDHIGRRR